MSLSFPLPPPSSSESSFSFSPTPPTSHPSTPGIPNPPPRSLTPGLATPGPSTRRTGSTPSAMPVNPPLPGFITSPNGTNFSLSSDSRNLPFATGNTTSFKGLQTSMTVTSTNGQVLGATVAAAPVLTDFQRRSVGPIVGGVFGGIALLALLVGIVIIARRRRTRTWAHSYGEISKQAQGNTAMPYQYNQPPMLSSSGTSADLKGNITYTRTSISKYSSAVPQDSYAIGVGGRTREEKRLRHPSEFPIATNGQSIYQHLGSNTSSPDRRLTMQTMASESQRTVHSEALPPYNPFLLGE